MSARRIYLARLRSICNERSVIFGYHGVGRTRLRDDLSLLQVRPERFREQLELMRDAGFEFVTVSQLLGLSGSGDPPPGYAAVSFDDGMRNNLTTALPLMAGLEIPGTVYVTVGFLGGQSPWVKDPVEGRMMNGAELHAIAAAGWEVGAHTMTHADLSTLAYEQCRFEIEESKKRLEELLDTQVKTFAYPFGRSSPEAVRAARDSGLRSAVLTGVGSWDRFQVKRVMIGALDPLPIAVMKVADRYEPLLRSRPVDLLRRTSKRVRAGMQRRNAASL